MPPRRPRHPPCRQKNPNRPAKRPPARPAACSKPNGAPSNADPRYLAVGLKRSRVKRVVSRPGRPRRCNDATFVARQRTLTTALRGSRSGIRAGAALWCSFIGVPQGIPEAGRSGRRTFAEHKSALRWFGSTCIIDIMSTSTWDEDSPLPGVALIDIMRINDILAKIPPCSPGLMEQSPGSGLAALAGR